MTSRPCLLRAGSRIGAVQDRDVVVNCFFLCVENRWIVFLSTMYIMGLYRSMPVSFPIANNIFKKKHNYIIIMLFFSIVHTHRACAVGGGRLIIFPKRV